MISANQLWMPQYNVDVQSTWDTYITLQLTKNLNFVAMSTLKYFTCVQYDAKTINNPDLEPKALCLYY